MVTLPLSTQPSNAGRPRQSPHRSESAVCAEPVTLVSPVSLLPGVPPSCSVSKPPVDDDPVEKESDAVFGSDDDVRSTQRIEVAVVGNTEQAADRTGSQLTHPSS